MLIRRFILVFGALQCALLPATPLATPKFFEQNCFDCHDADTKKGGLDMTALKLHLEDANDFAEWVKVHDRMDKGEMPPPKAKKRPPAQEMADVTAWLDKELTNADLMRRDAEGRAALRRITRTEYENTIRDLFDLPNLDVKEMLPTDGTRHGYDKVSEALDLSHVQLSRYMDAADYALDAAIATRPTPPPVVKKRIYPAMGNNFTKMVGCGNGVLVRLAEDGNYEPDPRWPVPGKLLGKEYMDSYQAAVKAGIPHSKSAMALFHPNDNYMQTGYVFCPIYQGRYKIRLSLWSFMWNAGAIEPSPKTEVGMLHIGQRTLGYFDAPSLHPLETEITPWLNPGGEIFFDDASLFKHDSQVRQLAGGGAAYVGPAIATDWMEVEGPLYDQLPPKGHQLLFGNLPIKPFDPASGARPPHREPLEQSGGGYCWPQLDDLHPEDAHPPLCTVYSANPAEDATKLLAAFLPRAFRRPVPNDEVQRYEKLVEGRLAAHDCFEDAMRYAYKAALTSASFLFRVEAPGKLTDLALASRLSFWLWGSTPDDGLLTLAMSNQLHDPKVMYAQVERLLNDPKSERFINDFLDQWLRLREIDATDPDSQLYPEYHIYLKESMLAETRAFFRELINNNLSATNIVSSDFLMLNERLAEHYRFIGPKGSRIQKVSIPPNCERGGFIAQGSVMKITANGTVTSPVMRGIWLNERILGNPIPPPPAGVPAIDPDTHGATTIREQLQRHRADPVCAACHAKMDPAGFALEEFDVIGGLRSRYRSIGAGDFTSRVFPGGWRPVYKVALPVETSGTLPDGTSFKDIIGLRQHLMANQAQIVRNFAQHVLIYATGAELTYADRKDLEHIVAESEKHSNGIRDLLHIIAESDLFQKK